MGQAFGTGRVSSPATPRELIIFLYPVARGTHSTPFFQPTRRCLGQQDWPVYRRFAHRGVGRPKVIG